MTNTPGTTPRPTLGRIVIYRGKEGLQARRAAIVSATVDSLDPRGVQLESVPGLDSDLHVHLFVLTPSASGFFVEYNIGPGDEPGQWSWPARV